MIAYIRGILALKSPTRIVIEASGVGYEIVIPLSTYERLPREGEEALIKTFHAVREDDEALFGFATEDEREMFAKLLSVNGVGGRIAMAILSGASLGELSLAIASGEAKRLSAIKGVGKKTAEKICLELRDKVRPFAGRGASAAGESPLLADSIAALRALGFGDEAAAKMLSSVFAAHAEIESVEQAIRLALAAR